MKSFQLGILVFISFLFGFTFGQIDICDTVEEDLAICYQIYQPQTVSNPADVWVQNCENVECFLQCMVDAIGDCYLSDKYFTYDISVLIVNYRAACSNLDMKVSSLIECIPYNVTCLAETNATEYILNSIQHLSNGDYSNYKEAYCSYTQLQKECILTDVTDNCTAEEAEFFESILVVSTSLAQCGDDQTHTYFNTYNGTINCLNPYTLATTQKINTTWMTSDSSLTTVSSSFEVSNSSTESTASTVFQSSLSTPSDPSTLISSVKTSTSPRSSSTPDSTTSPTSVTETTISPMSSTTETEEPIQSTLSTPNSSQQASSSLSIQDSSIATSTDASLSTAVTHAMVPENCETVEEDLAICYQIYQPQTVTNPADVWIQNCENVECFLQCMVDAIGDCYLSDKYFTYDISVLIVNYRAACSNLDIKVSSLIECFPYNVTCLADTNATEYLLHSIQHLSNGDYSNYKEAYCSYTQLQKECILTDVTGNCTAEEAEFFESILVVSTSLAQCGDDQTHTYFNTYNGTINCLNPYTLPTTHRINATWMTSDSSLTTVSSSSEVSTSSTLSTASSVFQSSLSTLSDQSTPVTPDMTSTSTRSSSTQDSISSMVSTSPTPNYSLPISTSIANESVSVQSTSQPHTTSTTSVTETTISQMSSTTETEEPIQSTLSTPTSSKQASSSSSTGIRNSPTATSTEASLSTAVTHAMVPENCDTVEEDLAICYQIYQPQTVTNPADVWVQNCENVECFLQCMIDAIGDCYLSDRYFTYDISVLIVNYRAACSNLDIKVSSLIECIPYNVTCLEVTNATEYLIHSIQHLSDGDYSNYKEAYCSYTQLQKECILTDVTDNCTVEEAEFFGSILVVSTSLAQCGDDQTHSYFNTYNGTINCLNPYTLTTPSIINTTEMTSVSSFTTAFSSSGVSTSSTLSTSSSVLQSSLSTLSDPSTSLSFDMTSTSPRSSSTPHSASSLVSTSSTPNYSLPKSTSIANKSVSVQSSSTPYTSSTMSVTVSSTISQVSTTETEEPMQSTLSSPTSSKQTSSSLSTQDSSIATSTEASLSTAVTHAMGCSLTDTLTSLQKCFTVSLDVFNTSSIEQLLSDFCENVECNIQCYVDSVGDCYKEDKFFTFDTEVVKVTDRAFCANYTETLLAFEQCRFDNGECLTTLATSVSTVVQTHYTDGNYTEYRKAYCGSLSTFKACVASSTISNCNPELATLFRSIYLASSSYSKCEQQNHEYFTTFGGDVTCGARHFLSERLMTIIVSFFTLLCVYL